MRETASLETVDKELFGRVWAIIEEIGQQERHFNNLQTVYRTMASTWLLSSFGAMGYLLSAELRLDVSRELMVAAVGLVACVGILLLWVVDFLVYQQLLGSCFAEGYVLENRYAWLPPVRHGMLDTQKGKGVLSRVVGFYLAPAILLIAIASVAFTVWLLRKGEGAGSVAGIALGLGIAFAVTKGMLDRTRTGEPVVKRMNEGRPAP